jgi:1,5-anhydro-D-fructose reductase (1,5-anhydro-D-mannitol-forming)
MKWGLIGASDIAATRVIPALKANNQEITWVQSSNSTHAEEYSKQHGIANFTTDINKLLSSDVDAVYISSTNEKHFDQAMAAVNAGKHILCEKPIAMKLVEAKKMVIAAKDANLVFATNHHIRIAGSHRMVRAMIEAGQLGDLISIRINHAVALPDRLKGWRLDNPAAGAGVVLDIVVHDVDTLRYLIGSNISEVAGLTNSFGLGSDKVEDSAMVIYKFENGVLGTSHESFAVKYNETSLEIHGSKASIFMQKAMTQDPVTQVFIRDDNGYRELEVSDREDLYVKAIRQFGRAVEFGESPYATGDDGYRSLQGALAVLESVQSKKVITLGE